MPYDYASAQNAIARQRKLAEMLQQQAFAPTDMPTDPRARLSALAPITKGLQGAFAAWQADKADKASAADAATRESEASKLMGEIPTDTPGVPSQPIAQEQVGAPPAPQAPPPPGLEQAFGPGGMPGAGVPPKDNEFTGSGSQIAAGLLKGEPPPANPLAPPVPEGPPLLPQNPLGAEGGAQPFALPEKKDMSFPGMIPKKFTDAIEGKESTPQEWAAWGSKFRKLGPDYDDIAKTATAGALKAAMPQTKQEKAALEEVRANHIAVETQRIAELRRLGEKDAADRAQRELDSVRRSEDKRYTTDENNAARRDVAAMIRAGKGDGSGMKQTMSELSDNGNPLAWGKDSAVHEVIGGKLSPEPYKGGYTGRTQLNQGVKSAGVAKDAMNDMQSLITMIAEVPGSWEPAQGAATILPDAMGLQQWASGASDAQMDVRRQAMAYTGNLKHTLYGANLTAAEQKESAPHQITLKDDEKTVLQKLRARMEIEQRHYDALPDSVKATYANQRGGGGGGGTAKPAAAAALTPGKSRSVADIRNDPAYK
jgi:hypothetical protein